MEINCHIVVVQLLSLLQLWDPMDCSMPGFPVLWSSGVCANSCPLSWWCSLTISSSVAHFFFCLQSFPDGKIRVFFNESALCIRWQNYWSFSNRPSNEYPGFISFRIDWFDLLEVQRTLKSLLHEKKTALSAPFIRWLKYWSFSFSISPSNEYLGWRQTDKRVGSRGWDG